MKLADRIRNTLLVIAGGMCVAGFVAIYWTVLGLVYVLVRYGAHVIPDSPTPFVLHHWNRLRHKPWRAPRRAKHK